MTLRNKKFALRAMGLLLVVSGMLVTYWGFRGACSVSMGPALPDIARSRIAHNPAPDLLPRLKDFEGHWDKPLRRPLFDPPPVVVPPPKKEPPPPLNVRLVGTIIEPGKTVAMLSNARNTLEFKQVGDTLGTGKMLATVTAIENSRVVIQYAGETVVLTMQDGGRR